MPGLTVVATADVHSPRYLSLLKAGLVEAPRECSLVVWAGDMVLRGRLEALEPVLEAFRKKYPGTPIVAVFGNEEYWGMEEAFREEYPDVVWLDDEYRVLDLDGAKVAVVGTRGALDRPTSWQRRNKPELWEVYAKRPRVVEDLVARARGEADLVILVSHYALTFKTVEGEPRRIWPEMGSRRMEETVRRSRPDLAIHGHAHNARQTHVRIDGVPVYNVSLPAMKHLAVIGLKRPVSLVDFFQRQS